MLSSVTINCQVTKIVINPGSQLSVLKSVSQMSQVPMIAPLDVLQWRDIGRLVVLLKGYNESVRNVIIVSMVKNLSDGSVRV